MRSWLLLFALLLTGSLQAAVPPQLLLDVVRFRNDDIAVKGAVVELYATVPGQSLTYKRRAPKVFQAAASVTLEIIREDGSAAYQETITLKPPVLSDTSVSLKNPVSFQKRVLLPDGKYTLRGQVRDQYRAGQNNVVEQPLLIESGSKGLALSDIVLLARPASKSAEASNFVRGGFNLTRAPGGLYGRGADRAFFYGELYNVKPEQTVQLRYRLRLAGAAKDALTTNATVKGALGQSTPVVGELDMSKLPGGDFTLTIEGRDAKNKVLFTKNALLHRNVADYAPAGVVAPR
ncbi:hypothetical protein [Hymenobacter chitinivorans]|uniref:Macroglobulin domain-containing protein n=1 Tax=Hymenobacter chitinivorans DSM 11115 TaxID=1121954 RepID=A0A2M9BMI6_9BACT|nr:hypothetical protein [Hymenobacter chitinivorans]PJJ59110.1 hypothetical protein CLV45_0523 [Hymenobacter chitinivorans DSM 11115]